ncbi:MFS transporter [Rhodovarius crocodyli]|uniref:MFS transporter n=1 Tax=Rhodovarius crocodyli TaxID=1979269 RepID=A0A437MG87_9PROT|nr:MFS transporter [Rhodovarius crocodyli]RVT96622.1 MFS transporter [Rhodovarius crocodyli]
MSPPAVTALDTAIPASRAVETPYIEQGSTEFRLTAIALFCAGLATFTLLYAAQPILPVFSREFGISASYASLAISLPSIALAIGTLIASSLSEALGRKPLMLGAVFISAGLTLASAFAPNWESFLVLRTLQGLALSGLPAAAMAYLAEEVHPRSIGLAMGMYISGNALGGMAGRVGSGMLGDVVSWHVSMGAMGVLGLVSAVVFWRALRPSRHFRPRPLNLRALAQGFEQHLREPGLRVLFLQGLLLMGSFVTIYNYIGYRLISLEASPVMIGLVYTTYIVGIAASTLIGSLGDKLGRARLFWMTIGVIILGLIISLHHSLLGAVLGLAVITLGFFGAHSMASAWVGRRALKAKSQASSLYVFCTYGGASLMGWIGGMMLEHWGWEGVVGLVGGCMAVALVGALWLARLKPLAQPVG